MRPKPTRWTKPAPAVLVLWAVGIAACVACVGCAAVDEHGISPQPDELPDALVTARCELYVRCRVEPDAETCRASTLPSPDIVTLLASLRRGRVVYRADRMAACLARASTLSCAFWDILDSNSDCREGFEGTLLQGQACIHDRECLSGLCDISDCGFSCCPGFCRPPSSAGVPIGGTCLSTQFCAGGFCGPDQICAPRPAAGEPCTYPGSCQHPLTCYGGTCRQLPERGEACDRMGLPPCNRLDDYCDEATRICLSYGSEGDPCTTSAPPSFPNDTCAAYAWCDAGTCSPLPRIGEPCTPVGHCLPGLDCDFTTDLCVLMVPTPTCR